MVSLTYMQNYQQHLITENNKINRCIAEENNQCWLVRLFTATVWTPKTVADATSYIQRGLTLEEAQKEIANDEYEVFLYMQIYEYDEDARTPDEKPLAKDWGTGRYYKDNYEEFIANRLRNAKLSKTIEEIFSRK